MDVYDLQLLYTTVDGGVPEVALYRLDVDTGTVPDCCFRSSNTERAIHTIIDIKTILKAFSGYTQVNSRPLAESLLASACQRTPVLVMRELAF